MHLGVHRARYEVKPNDRFAFRRHLLNSPHLYEMLDRSAAQPRLGLSHAQQRREHPVDAVGRHDHVPAARAAAYVRVLALLKSRIVRTVGSAIRIQEHKANDSGSHDCRRPRDSRQPRTPFPRATARAIFLAWPSSRPSSPNSRRPKRPKRMMHGFAPRSRRRSPPPRPASRMRK